MRSLFLSLVLGLATLGVAGTPATAEARHDRGYYRHHHGTTRYWRGGSRWRGGSHYRWRASYYGYPYYRGYYRPYYGPSRYYYAPRFGYGGYGGYYGSYRPVYPGYGW